MAPRSSSWRSRRSRFAAGTVATGLLRPPERSPSRRTQSSFTPRQSTSVRPCRARRARPTCEKSLGIACYEPAQIQRAYDLGPLFRAGTDGKGQTIVIVDSFGSPTIGHDLTVFDRDFQPACPPSFTVIQPAGAVPPYEASADREGWAGEATLDVEWAHTMAPGASILLVETPTSENEGTSGFPQIVAAELYVIKHHLGGVISQSFGATEQTFPTAQALLALRSAYIDAAESTNNVTVLAASGDFGAADVGPDGSTYLRLPGHVVAGQRPPRDRSRRHAAASRRGGQPHVSRHRLERHLRRHGNRLLRRERRPESAGQRRRQVDHLRAAHLPERRGANRGPASRRARRLHERSLRRGGRHLPELRRSKTPGWYPVCGTSEATPLFAGVVALADQEAGHPLGTHQPGPLRSVGFAGGRHRGHHQRQQHGLVHPGRQAPDGDRLPGFAGLRPRIGSRHDRSRPSSFPSWSRVLSASLASAVWAWSPARPPLRSRPGWPRRR